MDNIKASLSSDQNNFFYIGGFHFLPYYFYLKSIDEKVILLTSSLAIYEYAKSIDTNIYFLNTIEGDLNLKNPFNSISYLYKVIKFKLRVKFFINQFKGAKIFHNVECVDICFLYLLRECRDTKLIKTYKFNNQTKVDPFIKKSFGNYYFILYPWVYSKIFRLSLTAKNIDGAPLICANQEYSNTQLNLDLNKIENINYLMNFAPKKLQKISNEIVVILAHSFKGDCYYYDSKSLKEIFEFLHRSYSNILYKLHPGHPDYFSSMKKCNFRDSIRYYNNSNIPNENIDFTNCVILSLNSTGIMNLKSNSNIKSFFLMDLVDKSDNWDHKKFKSSCESGLGNSTFIKTYKELKSEIDSFFGVSYEK